MLQQMLQPTTNRLYFGIWWPATRHWLTLVWSIDRLLQLNVQLSIKGVVHSHPPSPSTLSSLFSQNVISLHQEKHHHHPFVEDHRETHKALHCQLKSYRHARIKTNCICVNKPNLINSQKHLPIVASVCKTKNNFQPSASATTTQTQSGNLQLQAYGSIIKAHTAHNSFKSITSVPKNQRGD